MPHSHAANKGVNMSTSCKELGGVLKVCFRNIVLRLITALYLSHSLSLTGACAVASLSLWFLSSSVASLFLQENGFTALMWAARSGNAEVAEVLVKAGADKNANAKVSPWHSHTCPIRMPSTI